MSRYIIVSLLCGILFGVMDGLINANSYAQKLYSVYQPIARSSINAFAGVAIDLVYGFVIAGLFLILYQALPGANGLVKGLSYAMMAWFFRVLMSVASDWMMFRIPPSALLYKLGTGLLEMLVLGLLLGAMLKPAR